MRRVAGDPDDVISPITPNNQAERARLGYPGPQNYQLRDVSGREISVLHHSPFTLARELLGESWRDYYFFTFERNPFDRIISQYYWEVRPEPWTKGAEPFIPDSIEDLLTQGSAELLSNWPLYADGDTVAVDFVGRYENFEEDLAGISERIGLSERRTALAEGQGGLPPGQPALSPGALRRGTLAGRGGVPPGTG